MPIVNNITEEQAKKVIINETIQLKQLNDGLVFLTHATTDDTKNFFVSPFFKNRCGSLYCLIADKKLKKTIEQNLQALGFCDFFELFSATKNYRLSAVDFILTNNHRNKFSKNKNLLLTQKGVVIGNGILAESLENKQDCDNITNKILNNFKVKFNERASKYAYYLKQESDACNLYKFISVAHFTSSWEDNFQDHQDNYFTLNDGYSIFVSFMQAFINTIIVSSDYGNAYRLFCKGKTYALDIILPSTRNKNTCFLHHKGYLINLIKKLNISQIEGDYKKCHLIMPKFEFIQRNNDITTYIKKSLLDDSDIDKGINLTNSSNEKTTVILQDMNIKVDTNGINVDETDNNPIINSNIDDNAIEKSNKIIISEPFLFMLSELDYSLNNYVTIKKIIALGKINNPNIIE
jgi:hypothetical protein